MFWWLVWLEIALAAATAVGLLLVTAPYGRHLRAGWGPTIPSRVGWIAMESPAVIVFAAVFVGGFAGLAAWEATGAAWVLFGLWQLHYLHRTFIFPFRTRSTKPMPLLVAALAFAFNCLNATINSWWIGHLATYSISWLWDSRFIGGTLVFLAGMAINLHSDHILLQLRAPGETGYRIPRGGLFRYVSCPNYLGEVLEWVGFALAAWSPAGAAFALYTMANLIPRSLQNHRWYQEQFPDYPQRKAILPGIL